MSPFRLFAYMMQQVYTSTRPKIETIGLLKDRIYLYFWELSPELCKSWTDEFTKRLRLIIDNNGGNIEQFVNKV